MIRLLKYLIPPALLIFLFYGCGSSTGTRYEKEETTSKEEKTNVVEDFDITPYKTKIEIEEKPSDNSIIADAWFGYEPKEQTTNNNRKIIATVDGYRVLVVATDNMEEANSIKQKVYEQTNHKEVYISFEPPFYKVKVGDFTEISAANDLKFKLNQLGYSEARVVQESVNIFEE